MKCRPLYWAGELNFSIKLQNQVTSSGYMCVYWITLEGDLSTTDLITSRAMEQSPPHGAAMWAVIDRRRNIAHGRQKCLALLFRGACSANPGVSVTAALCVLCFMCEMLKNSATPVSLVTCHDNVVACRWWTEAWRKEECRNVILQFSYCDVCFPCQECEHSCLLVFPCSRKTIELPEGFS